MVHPVQEQMSKDFHEALQNAVRDEPRLSVTDKYGISLALHVDGGHTHSYWTYAGLGMWNHLAPEQWLGHVSLTYATDTNGYYSLLHLTDLPVRDVNVLAALVVATVKQHMSMDFEPPHGTDKNLLS